VYPRGIPSRFWPLQFLSPLFILYSQWAINVASENL
jgi:hypothetical protein